MSFLTPVWNYVNAMVHPTAARDAITAARHRAFIASRLIGSFAVMASFPIYVAFRGVPSVVEIMVFGWLLAPILIAYYLSRSGRYESAHGLSSLALAGLVLAVAWRTGGVGSFAAPWLVVIPFEAAMSGSRRVIALAAIIALAAAGLLLAAGAGGAMPTPAMFVDIPNALAMLGITSAVFYATGLAFGAESLARTGLSLLCTEEDRYRLLARNLTDVITTHGRNSSVQFASPAAELLFGVPARDLMGHGLYDRVHLVDRPAYLTTLADAATLGEIRTVEFRARRGGSNDAGQFIWVEMRCRLLNRADDTAGAAREVVSVLRDISERKAQEHAIEAAQAESKRANAAKNRFLATMSHELRTPLNAIIGFSDMLSNESLLLNAARKHEYAKLINESGRHLLSVVNGILDMSKMETGNFEISPEPFMPTQLLTGCRDLLALKAREAGVDIKMQMAAELPEIFADRRAFNQILINLLSNAIKFTPRGGTVTVGAACDGARLVVSVEDTGVGIDEQDVPRLGEAFFQARGSYDRRHDGSGLGLSIVKGLIELHGGEFEIRSRLGEGTRVIVRLPLDCEGRRAADPIRLVRDRTKELATEANMRVKKSA